MAVPLLVTVAVLTVFVAVWSWSQIGDTDNFVANVGPLAEDEDVVDGVAHELTQRIVKRYPEVPSSAVEDVLQQVMHTRLFQNVWTNAVRIAHRQFLDSVDSDSDEVRLDLGALLSEVSELLQPLGLNVLDPSAIEDMDDIVVWRSERVRQVSLAVEVNDWLAFLLPPVALGVLLAALVLSTDTRRTARTIGLGIALVMAFTALLAWLGRRVGLDGIKNDLERSAAQDVWDTATERLWQQTQLLFVAGTALAVVAWLCLRRSTD